MCDDTVQTEMTTTTTVTASVSTTDSSAATATTTSTTLIKEQPASEEETSLKSATVNVEVTEIPTSETHLTANNMVEENVDAHSTQVAGVEDINSLKSSAVTGITLSSTEHKSHVLTIEISSSSTTSSTSSSCSGFASGAPQSPAGAAEEKEQQQENSNCSDDKCDTLTINKDSVECSNGETNSAEVVLIANSNSNNNCIIPSSGIKTVEMVLQKANPPNTTQTTTNGNSKMDNSSFLYYMMTSGQYASDMDSGTCSDIEILTPPPLPKKMSSSKSKTNSLSETLAAANADNANHTDTDNGHHHDDYNNINLKHMITKSSHNRAVSFTDSESSSSESSLSCDSLSSQEQNTIHSDTATRSPICFLPDSLLKDIRECKLKLSNSESNNLCNNNNNNSNVNNINNNNLNDNNNNNNDYVPQSFLNQLNKVSFNIMRDCDTNNDSYETDKFYKFHLNEHISDEDLSNLSHSSSSSITENDESFAGFKDIHSGTSTIRSSKGTIRGVKNRVRNGIATFLQMQCNISSKNYKEKDAGKVVVYTTSMGIVRDTYAKCTSVKQILKTLLIKFEERDVFMSNEYQVEIKERMQANEIKVPQLFVDGYYVGNAAQVERLNETGELRKMLKPFKCMESSFICKTCGGYRLLPCPSCGGSKKSIHRNHFTTEFVALKCMNCDEVGLVKCHSC